MFLLVYFQWHRIKTFNFVILLLLINFVILLLLKTFKKNVKYYKISNCKLNGPLTVANLGQSVRLSYALPIWTQTPDQIYWRPTHLHAWGQRRGAMRKASLPGWQGCLQAKQGQHVQVIATGVCMQWICCICCSCLNVFSTTPWKKKCMNTIVAIHWIRLLIHPAKAVALSYCSWIGIICFANALPVRMRMTPKTFEPWA